MTGTRLTPWKQYGQLPSAVILGTNEISPQG
jgi:hypothetical protein